MTSSTSSRVGDEVLDRGQYAVSLTAFSLGGPVQGQPGLCYAWLPGHHRGILYQRLTVLLRNSVGHVVAVASGVRPADVVEHQQGQLLARRPLADDAQLLAERVVVVIAVEHDRVGELHVAQDPVADVAKQAQLGMFSRQLLQLGGRGGVDRDDLALARGPLQQLRRQQTAIGPDLDHRACPGDLEAADQQLAQVGERVADAVLVGPLLAVACDERGIPLVVRLHPQQFRSAQRRRLRWSGLIALRPSLRTTPRIPFSSNSVTSMPGYSETTLRAISARGLRARGRSA